MDLLEPEFGILSKKVETMMLNTEKTELHCC